MRMPCLVVFLLSSATAGLAEGIRITGTGDIIVTQIGPNEFQLSSAAAPRGLQWRGAWNAEASYLTGDAVRFGDSSFIALASNSNESPNSSTKWDLLARGGPSTAESEPPPKEVEVKTDSAPAPSVTPYFGARSLGPDRFTPSGFGAPKIAPNTHIGAAVYGETANAHGVIGVSNTWRGVYGVSTSNAGVVGESQSFDGIRGIAHHGNFSGISGTNDGSGIGVFGQTNAGSTTTRSGVYGLSTGTGGIGVIGRADSGFAWGVYGTTLSSHVSSAAVYGRAEAGAGVHAASSTGSGLLASSTSGFAINALGNAKQSRDKGGFVKAMLFVLANRTIARCYNSQTGSSTNGCGFSVEGYDGSVLVRFGFQVTDRFLLVTPSTELGTHLGVAPRLYIHPNAPNDARVWTFDKDGNLLQSDFFIFVF